MIALALLVVLGAPAAGPSGAVPREAWVRAGAPVPGDGSPARPFADLAAALSGRGRVRVHVGAGRYAGPVRLPAGAELVADGEVVLHAPAGGPVVHAPAGGRLAGLTLEGGSWGLWGAGTLELERVRVRGGSRGGVRWEAGRLAARQLELTSGAGPVPGTAGAGPDSAGLSLGRGVRAEVRGLRVAGGGWARGLDLEGVRARLEAVALEEVPVGLRQRGGQVALHGLRARAGGSEAGLLVTAGGRLELGDAQLTGYGYGLLTRDGAQVTARGLTSAGAAIAGLALVGSQGRLTGVRVERPGTFGAVQLVRSRVTLEQFALVDARDVALSALGGRLVARAGQVRGVGGDGTAVLLRETDGELAGLEVRGAAVGVHVSSHGRVRVRAVRLVAPTEAGLLAERGARLEARGLTVEGQGAAAAVGLSGARLVLEDVALDPGAAAGWLALECARGASAGLTRTPPPPPEARACARPAR